MDYIPEVLDRVKKQYLQKTYGLKDWKDPYDFVEQFALKSGRLLKAGEADFKTCAKMILTDWLRGRLPFFVPPPMGDEAKKAVAAASKDGEGDTDAPERLPQVKQLFKKINPVHEYDDIDAGEHIEDEIFSDEEEEEDDGDDKQVVDWDKVYKDAGEDTDEEIHWSSDEGEGDEEDALKAAGGTSAAGARGKGKGKGKGRGGRQKKRSRFDSTSSGDEGSDDAEEGRGRKKTRRQKKEARKTTNKAKATNYYDFANVKNKSNKTGKRSMKSQSRRNRRVCK
eukprot:TRINITY_DN169_c0_g1_i5.p1 TRINITY_DN169_c0_g1~~TRINITY_DN169_c0_g1_i5.p1  ORF type:complete len:281 (-),score=108.39 TRINITY_DN169_c0_g1_i5:238-1080(-)